MFFSNGKVAEFPLILRAISSFLALNFQRSKSLAGNFGSAQLRACLVWLAVAGCGWLWVLCRKAAVWEKLLF
jgi:hypothetical protein